MNERRAVAGVLLCLALAAPLAARAQAPAAAPADLVVLNGRVLTVDPGFRIVEAVAVRGGFFILVGSNEDARKLIGSDTRVIDAGGKSVVPGLIDSHVHA